MADPTQIVQTQTTIPDYAKPYVEQMLGRYFGGSDKPGLLDQAYTPYSGQRTAEFKPLQQQAIDTVSGLTPGQTMATGQDLMQRAGLAALGAQYTPGQFQNQFQAPGQYDPGRFRAERVGTQSFAQPGSAQTYMSPYMQSVVEAQQREARRASDIAAQGERAQAVGRGAFGGSRQAIVEAERNRNLATQLGDIQATGLQAAYQQAQQQFNAEQQARLQAALANQQTGLSAQQMAEQSRQFGAGQGLQAALAGAQYGQAAQQLGEQSRQFGAGLGLQGAQTGLQAAQGLAGLGMNQLGLQQQYGGMQQQQQQNVLNQQYQDFLAQRQYPYQQLAFASDMLRGLPLSQTAQQTYQAPPSMLSQVAGLGTAALGASRLGLFKEGGEVDDAPAGLADLAIYNMG